MKYGMEQQTAGTLDPKYYANQAMCDEAPTPELVRILNRLHDLHDSLLGSNNRVDGVCSRLGLYAEYPTGIDGAEKSAPSSLISNIDERISGLSHQAERHSELARRLERLA